MKTYQMAVEPKHQNLSQCLRFLLIREWTIASPSPSSRLPRTSIFTARRVDVSGPRRF
jgi:hypothetical protein